MSDVSGTFDTLVDRVLFLEKERPKQLAVAFKKEQVSYGELGKRMRLAAARLERLGICRGERVLFSALSKPEMVAVYLGIQYLGAVAVFVDKNAAPSQAAAIAKEAGASVFLTDKPMKELACRRFSLKEICALPESDREENTACPKAVYRKPEPEELAELLFTSGTTGRPKGVMLSYRAVYHILKNTAVAMGIREDERILLPLPLNHSFALRVLRAALFQGAGVILQNGFTFAREIENNLDLYGCTALAVVPASVETIARQMQDRFPEIMGRFRYIEASAGSLSVEQRKRLTSQLPNTVIYNTWGSSESGGALFLNVTETVTDPVRRGALGKPLPGIEVRVLDENGNEMESDREHPGRMALRGPMQMSGYWGQEELTEQTLKDGWLLTGDLVYTDADGYVYMLGRIDDQINVGGEKVSPTEVENAACEYP
ncbi:MAG: acyl--CoA ligase, partial [Lachnospiraceae bacterium]|nr:acyl--CoA ligase [Lachnospiraceae bacterium]